MNERKLEEESLKLYTNGNRLQKEKNFSLQQIKFTNFKNLEKCVDGEAMNEIIDKFRLWSFEELQFHVGCFTLGCFLLNVMHFFSPSLLL